MEFLAEYGLFLAKALTVVISFALIIGIAVSAGHKGDGEKLKVEYLNKKLSALKSHLQESVLDKKQLKQIKKDQKKNKDEEPKRKVYVLDFNGDIKATDSKQLKEEITALLSLKDHVDEVVVKLESGGGMVHQYGYAASQLDRIKKQGIPLTVCVDKVAASGGYMMAVVADKIIAAPFAVIGSIGVIAQVPNFNRLLKKNDVDFEVHTAGEYKRTLTMFGENTDKAREKFKEDLQDVHGLFKHFIDSHRNAVDLEKVANGDVWYGQDAIKENLVDDIKTSDEYLLDACNDADVYLLSSKKKVGLAQKLGLAASAGISKGFENTIEKLSFQKWYM
mgnify:FL=1